MLQCSSAVERPGAAGVSFASAGAMGVSCVRSAAVLGPSRTARPRGPATGFGSGRAWGLDLGEPADLAGEGEEVMGGVERLV